MQELVIVNNHGFPMPAVPRAIKQLGPAAGFAWAEYFSGTIRNSHTRKAYLQAVRKFLSWLEPFQVPMQQTTPWGGTIAAAASGRGNPVLHTEFHKPRPPAWRTTNVDIPFAR